MFPTHIEDFLEAFEVKNSVKKTRFRTFIETPREIAFLLQNNVPI